MAYRKLYPAAAAGRSAHREMAKGRNMAGVSISVCGETYVRPAENSESGVRRLRGSSAACAALCSCGVKKAYEEKEAAYESLPRKR